MTNNMNTLEESPSPGVYARMRDTTKHTAYFGTAQVLQRGIQFLLLPVFTRFLTTDEYGVLAFLTLTLMFALLLPGSIIIPPLLRSYYDYEDEDKRATVISTGFWLTVSPARS